MSNGKGGFIGQDGLNAPDEPTGVAGTVGDAQVSVAFTAPSDVGASAIIGYSVQSNNGDGTFVSSYDLSSASYDSVSFSVASQESSPYGMTFNNDGTKLYVTGPGTDTVFQYSLSTAFDLDTMSYDSVSFNANSQNTAIAGVAFNSNGTKMYLVGYNGPASVFQYTLSTAFDLSTASYDSVTFNVSSQASTAFGLAFNNDGTKMYIVSFGNDTIYQYSLSTAFDLSTASYDSVSLSVNAQEAAPSGMTFNNDGTKMYIVGENGDEVNQYGLSTAFDLSTASYDNIAFSLSSQDSTPADIAFSNDGTKMYMVGYNTDTVYQYSTGIVAGEYPTASPVVVTGLTNGTSYTFNVWAINLSGWSSPSGASASFSPAAPRGIFAGGYTGSGSNVMDYITISSTGDAADFGDLSATRYNHGGCSSATRGISAGGSSTTNVIEYVTIANTGNATDFGDLLTTRHSHSGCSNSTRGIFFGGVGSGGVDNVIQYITIATTGNATDFGDLSAARYALSGSLASPTRAVACGGSTSSNALVNIMEYVTIANTGNVTDFGNLTAAASYGNGASCNNTRGLIALGYADANVDTMDFITIASAGNAADFGNLSAIRSYAGSTAGGDRAVVAGGDNSGALNIIDYFTITSAGNATDFGDLTVSRGRISTMSNTHGGLS